MLPGSTDRESHNSDDDQYLQYDRHAVKDYFPIYDIFLRTRFEIRCGESYGVVFENRSAAYIKVREHRKRRKSRQMAAAVEFRRGSQAAAFFQPRARSPAPIISDPPVRLTIR